jgi:hypothetical protein
MVDALYAPDPTGFALRFLALLNDDAKREALRGALMLLSAPDTVTDMLDITNMKLWFDRLTRLSTIIDVAIFMGDAALARIIGTAQGVVTFTATGTRTNPPTRPRPTSPPRPLDSWVGNWSGVVSQPNFEPTEYHAVVKVGNARGRWCPSPPAGSNSARR